VNAINVAWSFHHGRVLIVRTDDIIPGMGKKRSPQKKPLSGGFPFYVNLVWMILSETLYGLLYLISLTFFPCSSQMGQYFIFTG